MLVPGGFGEFLRGRLDGPLVNIDLCREQVEKLEVGKVIDELICRAPKSPGRL